ncbi:MAG: hypothetical protein KDH94_05340 [Coxiellaceae bacterium]|nr:hypothetical protein [Coxiellaceae bacterium]
MKINRIISKIALLSAIALSPLTFASNAYVGVFGSSINAKAKNEYNYECIGTCGFNAYETYSSNFDQYGFGGGVQIGSWIPVGHHHLAYGFEVGIMGNSGKSTNRESNDLVPPSNSDLISRFSINISYELAAQLLAKLSPVFSAYIKGGAAVSRIDTSIEIVSNFIQGTPLSFPTVETSSDKYRLGWIAGLGLITHINNIDVFFEFDHMSYGSMNLSNIATPLTPPGATSGLLTRNYQDMSANILKFGANFAIGNI